MGNSKLYWMATKIPLSMKKRSRYQIMSW